MIIYSLHLVFTILFFIGNPWCCKKNNSILKFTNFQENTVDQYEKYRYKLDSINITWKFQNTDGVYNCKDCIKSSDYKSIAFFNINSISISEIKNLQDDSILFNIIFNQYSKFKKYYEEWKFFQKVLKNYDTIDVKEKYPVKIYASYNEFIFSIKQKLKIYYAGKLSFNNIFYTDLFLIFNREDKELILMNTDNEKLLSIVLLTSVTKGFMYDESSMSLLSQKKVFYYTANGVLDVINPWSKYKWIPFCLRSRLAKRCYSAGFVLTDEGYVKLKR